MPKSSLIAGAAASALLAASLAFAAHAAPRPALSGAAGPLHLIEDEENAEVQNLLEPESDQGTPMRSDKAPEHQHPASGENAEKALESTVGDDGVNAIQRESIPPE